MKIGEKTLTVRLGMAANQQPSAPPVPSGLGMGGLGFGIGANPLAAPISLGGLNIPFGGTMDPSHHATGLAYAAPTKVHYIYVRAQCIFCDCRVVTVRIAPLRC